MRITAVPVLLCATALAAQSWPTFYSAYEDGLDAQKRGDHALAARAFARAIALEPRPALQMRTYGLNFLPRYFPYLRLAESSLALGDLAAAQAALSTSEQLGVEPAPERTALRQRLDRLRQPAPAAPAAVPVPAPQAAPPVPVPVPVPVPAAPAVAPVQAPAPAVRQEVHRPAAPAPEARPAPVPVPVPVPEPAPAVVPVALPAPPAPHPGIPWRWGLGLAVLAAAAGVLVRRRFGRAAAAAAAVTAAPAGPPPEPAGAGMAFGPFTALHVLGRGGCATAYYGRHRETGVEVAIKVPHPHLAGDADFLARFRREASLGSLLDHPRVVKILDPGPREGTPWLAMEFIRGTTLEACMDGKGPLPVAQAVAVAGDIAEAIAYAHGKGVVHRDLKPANVMLNEGGAVVMDFGIARVLDAAMTSTTMYLGTPLYSAPECVMGGKAGPPADRYALGMLLFEMLTGHPPFHADTLYKILEAQRSQPLPDLAALRPFTPPRLVRLVERLCAKQPEERPEDMEMLAILAELRSSGPRPAATPPG